MANNIAYVLLKVSCIQSFILSTFTPSTFTPSTFVLSYFHTFNFHTFNFHTFTLLTFILSTFTLSTFEFHTFNFHTFNLQGRKVNKDWQRNVGINHHDHHPSPHLPSNGLNFNDNLRSCVLVKSRKRI